MRAETRPTPGAKAIRKGFVEETPRGPRDAFWAAWMSGTVSGATICTKPIFRDLRVDSKQFLQLKDLRAVAIQPYDAA